MLCRFGWSDDSRPGAGDGLVERRVDPTVGGDLGEQTLAVRAAQLLDLAIAHQRAEELGPLVLDLLQRGGVGREAGLGLLARAQAALVVEDLAQLLRRVEVEVVAAGDDAEFGAERVDLGRQAGAERFEFGDVDGDADVFHLRQHHDERVLDRAVELGHALRFEARHQRCGERVHGERVAPGTFGVGHRRAVEVELARRRHVARPGEAGVLLDEVGQRVPGLGRIDQVRGDGRVEGETVEVDADGEQRAHQRLDVVAVARSRARRAPAPHDRRRAAHAGSHATSADSASRTTASPVSVAAAGFADPGRGDRQRVAAR